MFTETLKHLTSEQKSELRTAGVSDQMRSDWLYNRRNPTEAELLLLELVSGVPVRNLLAEIAERRAKPKNLKLLSRALGKELLHRVGQS